MVEKESDLDIRNIFFAVLRKWRFVLIFSLCMMLLLAGRKFISGLRSLGNDAAITQQNSQYQSMIDAYNLSVLNLNTQLTTTQTAIVQKQHEKDFSYKYSIDPYKTVQWKHTYHIDIPKNDDGSDASDINAVINGISTTIQNADLQSSILPARKDQTEDDPILQLLGLAADNSLRTYTVTILAATEDDAKSFDAAITALLKAKLDNMNTQYGRFSFVDIDEAIKTYESSANASGAGASGDASSALATNENSSADASGSTADDTADFVQDGDITVKVVSSDTIQTINSDYASAMSSLQSNLTSINSQLEDLKYPEGHFTNRGTVLAATRKQAIIGFILGFVLAVFFIILWFLSKDTITGVDEFSKKTNVDLLGFLPRAVSGLPGKKLDQAINRLDEGATQSRTATGVKTATAVKEAAATVDVEKVIDTSAAPDTTASDTAASPNTAALRAIAAQVEALIPAEEEDSNVVILNCESFPRNREIAEQLVALAPDRFVTAGSLLADPDTVRLTKKAGTAMLLETRDHSRYSILSQELNLLNVMDVKVLGAVLL